MFSSNFEYVNNFNFDYKNLTLQSISVKLDVIRFYHLNEPRYKLDREDRVLVLSPDFDGGIENLSKRYAEKNGYDYIRLDYTNDTDSLKDLILNKYTHVINFFIDLDKLDLYIPLKLNGIKLTFVLCTPYTIYDYKPLYELSDEIWASNNDTLELLREDYPNKPIRILDYDSIIDIPIIERKIKSVRRLRVAWIGRINNLEKRFGQFETLVNNVYEKNKELFNKIEFAVFGNMEDKSYEKFLKSDLVSYYGYVVNPFIYTIDLVISTSKYECQSLTILEAHKNNVSILGYDLRMNYNNDLVDIKINFEEELYESFVKYCNDKL